MNAPLFFVFLTFMKGLIANPVGTSCSIDNGGCDQLCTELPPGQVTCSCNAISQLDSDGTSCIFSPMIFYTSVSGVIGFLKDNSHIPLQKSEQIISSSAPDYENNRIFFTTFGGPLGVFLLRELDLVTLQSKTIASLPYSIVYDMVYDSSTNSIFMAGIAHLLYIRQVDQNQNVEILRSGERYKSIAIDSREGLLYWNTFDTGIYKTCIPNPDPCPIVRVLEPPTANAVFAMTLDTSSKRILWINVTSTADFTKHSFLSSDYNGENIATLFEVPYAGLSNEILWNMLFVDGDIYWIKWLYTPVFEASIQRRSVVTGEVKEVLNLGFIMEYSLQYYAPIEKPMCKEDTFDCPNSLCLNRGNGNYEIRDDCVSSTMLQCSNEYAYCTKCNPTSLVFVKRCNKCLYTYTDSCYNNEPEFTPLVPAI